MASRAMLRTLVEIVRYTSKSRGDWTPPKRSVPLGASATCRQTCKKPARNLKAARDTGRSQLDPSSSVFTLRRIRCCLIIDEPTTFSIHCCYFQPIATISSHLDPPLPVWITTKGRWPDGKMAGLADVGRFQVRTRGSPVYWGQVHVRFFFVVQATWLSGNFLGVVVFHKVCSSTFIFLLERGFGWIHVPTNWG